VVLAGPSYGGAVISDVDADAGDLAGLVYVAGFAPEPGEHVQPRGDVSRQHRTIEIPGASHRSASRIPRRPRT